MRRSQAKSHCPILSKVMDVEKPEVKIAGVGLLWTLLQNGRQRRQVDRLSQGRNIVYDPIVRKRGRQSRRWCVRPWLHSERRLQFGHFNSAHGRIATRRRGILQKFPADRAHNIMFDELLNRIRPRIAKQDTWYRQAIDPGLK